MESGPIPHTAGGNVRERPWHPSPPPASLAPRVEDGHCWPKTWDKQGRWNISEKKTASGSGGVTREKSPNKGVLMLSTGPELWAVVPEPHSSQGTWL